MLDSASLSNTKIMASGDLNEYLIRDLVKDGAPIDTFGVGTELSTSRDDPALNGVYKLVGIRIWESEDDKRGRLIYKLKTSPGKKTYPGPKQIYRIVADNKIIRDWLMLEDEAPPSDDQGVLLLRKVFEEGRLLLKLPSIKEIQTYHFEQMTLLPRQYKDLNFEPKTFPVLYSTKLKMIKKAWKSA